MKQFREPTRREMASYWMHVVRSSPGGCWEWKGRLHGGYGQATVRLIDGKNTNRPAHRVAFEWLVGEIPDGLQLDHLCRNRACVNPSHLEPVTCRENLLRGNTVNARNAAKTHCRRGHEYNAENTRIYRTGNRFTRKCRQCDRINQAEYKAKRLAEDGRRLRKDAMAVTDDGAHSRVS